jgi:hypothetical protein
MNGNGRCSSTPQVSNYRVVISMKGWRAGGEGADSLGWKKHVCAEVPFCKSGQTKWGGVEKVTGRVLHVGASAVKV